MISKFRITESIYKGIYKGIWLVTEKVIIELDYHFTYLKEIMSLDRLTQND